MTRTNRLLALMVAIAIAAMAALLFTTQAGAVAPNLNDPAYWETQTEHPSQCFKHEAGDQTAHGAIGPADTVTLATFNQAWPGDHWELLVIKYATFNDVYHHPTANQAYQTGTEQDVSHWIVCKGETPPDTTTTTIPDTTTTSSTIPETTTSSSTTTVPETTTSSSTTTVPASSTTIADTTTTTIADTTTSTVVTTTQPDTTTIPEVQTDITELPKTGASTTQLGWAGLALAAAGIALLSISAGIGHIRTRRNS